MHDYGFRADEEHKTCCVSGADGAGDRDRLDTMRYGTEGLFPP